MRALIYHRSYPADGRINGRRSGERTCSYHIRGELGRKHSTDARVTPPQRRFFFAHFPLAAPCPFVPSRPVSSVYRGQHNKIVKPHSCAPDLSLSLQAHRLPHTLPSLPHQQSPINGPIHLMRTLQGRRRRPPRSNNCVISPVIVFDRPPPRRRILFNPLVARAPPFRLRRRYIIRRNRPHSSSVRVSCI